MTLRESHLLLGLYNTNKFNLKASIFLEVNVDLCYILKKLASKLIRDSRYFSFVGMLKIKCFFLDIMILYVILCRFTTLIG